MILWDSTDNKTFLEWERNWKDKRCKHNLLVISTWEKVNSPVLQLGDASPTKQSAPFKSIGKMQTCCPTQTAIKCAEGYACTYKISSDVAERVLLPLKRKSQFKTWRLNNQTARYKHFILQFAENGNACSVTPFSTPEPLGFDSVTWQSWAKREEHWSREWCHAKFLSYHACVIDICTWICGSTSELTFCIACGNQPRFPAVWLLFSFPILIS